MTKKVKNTAEIGKDRDNKGRFVEGTSIHKPLGSKKEKAFIEYFDEICEEIALKNKMSVEDVKKVIYKVGYAKAKEGNYQFYKDMLDRIHGQAKNYVEHSGELQIPIYGNKSISGHEGDTKDIPTNKENPGSVGGDIGK